jgi:hypothetical protein
MKNQHCGFRGVESGRAFSGVRIFRGVELGLNFNTAAFRIGVKKKAGTCGGGVGFSRTAEIRGHGNFAGQFAGFLCRKSAGFNFARFQIGGNFGGKKSECGQFLEVNSFENSASLITKSGQFSGNTRKSLITLTGKMWEKKCRH